MNQDTKRRFRWMCAAAILLLALLGLYRGLIWVGLEPWSLRRVRFTWAAHRGERLIRAVKAYERDKGVPPDSLMDLVPNYFQSIPGTGLSDYPRFQYARFTNSHYSLLWYDLGSRNGRPKAGLWRYADGDPEHAILALTIDQAGRVVEAYADRLPQGLQTNSFDATRWRTNYARMEMVRSLPERLPIPGAETNAVISLLGKPDGSRVLRDSPWELKIKCPWGLLPSFDVFFYWPTEKYPEHIYGGSTELIKGWAYVHE